MVIIAVMRFQDRFSNFDSSWFERYPVIKVVLMKFYFVRKFVM